MCKRLMLSIWDKMDYQPAVSALILGRQAIASPSFQTEASKARRDYWRNVFRSLVFLERCVRSTSYDGSS
jgi:hypothetical protein